MVSRLLVIWYPGPPWSRLTIQCNPEGAFGQHSPGSLWLFPNSNGSPGTTSTTYLGGSVEGHPDQCLTWLILAPSVSTITAQARETIQKPVIPAQQRVQQFFNAFHLTIHRLLWSSPIVMSFSVLGRLVPSSVALCLGMQAHTTHAQHGKFIFMNSYPRNRATEPRQVFQQFFSAVLLSPAEHLLRCSITAHLCAATHRLQITRGQEGLQKSDSRQAHQGSDPINFPFRDAGIWSMRTFIPVLQN